MTKKDVQSVMLKLLDEAGPLLKCETEKAAMHILITESFAPLVEKAGRGGKPAVYTTQIGDHGFRIEKVTNLFDFRCGSVLQMADLEQLKADGVNVSIAKNK